MWAYHNSRSALYRSPFGAVPVGGTVVLTLDVGGDSCACATLRVWIDGEGESYAPMDAEPIEHGTRFSCQYVTTHQALVWYSFIIERQDGSVVHYGAREGTTGGEGALLSWQPPSFQLTVYTPRTVQPQWFTSGIVYQIFPDRFARGRKWRERTDAALGLHTRGSDDGVPGPDRRIVQAWESPPEYDRDASGRMRAWDFYGGTLSGIEEHLSYLVDMGVTVLYLNPIFEARSNHRYDTADYLRIDTMLGTDEDFTRLCEHASRLGISVILDGVFNHVGADSRYFNRFQTYGEPGAWQDHEHADSASPYSPWFTFHEDGTYECWWGVDDLPSIKKDSASFREFIAGPDGVVRRWLRAGARGWRLDVADELTDEFIASIKHAAVAEKPEALVLGEVWEDASNKISYGTLRQYLLGDELDGAMNYPFRTAVLDFLCGMTGAAAASDALMSLVENYPPEALAASLNLLSSHDRPRLMSILGGAGSRAADYAWPEGIPGRLSADERADAHKRFWLAVLMQMTFAGVPSIYYGDEAGMDGLADPYNRGPFPRGGGDDDCRAMYRNAIQLRRTLPVLTDGAVYPIACGDDVLGWWRLPQGMWIDKGAVETGEAASRNCVCVLVNRNAFSACECTVPRVTPHAVELVENLELTGDEVHITYSVPPLSAAVIEFDEGPYLSVPLEPGCGVVCHITSIPNGTRPGTLGAPARAFVDYLARTKQSYWQMLPVNPPDEFLSPYAGISAFAGNEQLLSATPAELRERFAHFEPSAAYREFIAREASWLESYALFTAISDVYAGQPWQTWPAELQHYEARLATDSRFCEGVAFHRFCQWEFQREWDELCAYAHTKGISIIGDIPMYAAPHSADVWAHPELFCVDEAGEVEMQAGTPPDQFARAGQLWGNPTYRWDVMARDTYTWWRERCARSFALYDVVRLDHFLGFQSYFGISRGKDAAHGSWYAGPGYAFFQALYDELGPLPLVAEDLGTITPATRALRARVGCEGMDVLVFSDDAVRQGWTPQSGKVVYSSTHDTSTLVGWCSDHFGLDMAEAQKLAQKLMRSLYASDAPVVMSTLQDVLQLGDEARMNRPGTTGNNWIWQATTDELAASEPFMRNLMQARSHITSE